MRPSTCLLVLAALALPAAAHAKLEPTYNGPSKTGRAALASFNGLDRDHDRGLTLDELRGRGRQKGADALFALLDGDGDGRLSLKEFAGAGNGALIGRFDAYDANKDGFIARREFPNIVDPLLFAALDRDHDGRLSLSEVRPAFAGSRVAEDSTPQPRKPPRAKAPNPDAWCWIPVFGSGEHQWELQAPVIWGRCRTH